MAEDAMTTQSITITPQVFDVLKNAGLVQGDAPPPRPPTAPQPKVGDFANVQPVIGIDKTVQTIPSDRTQFALHMLGNEHYWLDFPPNDASWIPELDRLVTVAFTATKPVFMSANVEITEIVGGADTTGHYKGKLAALFVHGSV